jgi:hypothetical protein
VTALEMPIHRDHYAEGQRTCRHCGEEIVPCGPYGIGCWARGWKHAQFMESMPVGAHYCHGRSVNPVAEPAEA